MATAVERVDTLLDPRTTRVVDAHERRPGAQRHVGGLRDLVGVQLTDGSAEDGEVLAGHMDEPPEHRALTDDDAIARHVLVGHAEAVGAVHGIHRRLLERVLVQELLDPLTGGELALLVLLGDPLLASGGGERCPTLVQLVDLLLHALRCHG